MMHHADAELTSIELRFLFDCAIVARRTGSLKRFNAFVGAAEGLIRASLHDEACNIGKVASRKGRGEDIAAELARSLSPAAAAVFVLWSFRGARKPALQALIAAYGKDSTFSQVVRLLCHRLVGVERTKPTTKTAIEVAAPRCR